MLKTVVMLKRDALIIAYLISFAKEMSFELISSPSFAIGFIKGFNDSVHNDPLVSIDNEDYEYYLSKIKASRAAA